MLACALSAWAVLRLSISSSYSTAAIVPPPTTARGAGGDAVLISLMKEKMKINRHQTNKNQQKMQLLIMI
jgi:hypothetical protein